MDYKIILDDLQQTVKRQHEELVDRVNYEHQLMDIIELQRQKIHKLESENNGNN